MEQNSQDRIIRDASFKIQCITERSCEDPATVYLTTHDGLRLIFRDGEYVGWYACGSKREKNGGKRRKP